MTNSLTGIWDGTYMQPDVGTISSLATLIESTGSLTGSVTEPCASPKCPVSTHSASLAGSRLGHTVSFVKRYEPAGFGYTHVFYEGAVNADATEIDGRWRLPDDSATGTFLMIRSGKPAEATMREERTEEPAR